MKNAIKLLAVVFTLAGFKANAQGYESTPGLGHGNTLNLGVGVGYYNYIDIPMLSTNLNYEIGITRDLTLAPFVGLYTYTNTYLWGDDATPMTTHRYREIAVPMGVKANYYFDDLIGLPDQLDLYAGGSLGYVLHNEDWDDDYFGDRSVAVHPKPLFATAHVGSRYNFNRFGVFLDVSTAFAHLGISYKLSDNDD